MSSSGFVQKGWGLGSLEMRVLVGRTSQIAIDIAMLSCALGLAFLLRFDWQIPESMVERLFRSLPWVVGLQFAALAAAGVQRFSWRFVSLRESLRILLALACSTALMLSIRLIAGSIGGRDETQEFHEALLLPIGVILINFVVAFLALTGVRVVRRLVGEHSHRTSLARNGSATATAVPTLLIGAGAAGAMVAREISGRPDLGIKVVGFLDDDPQKHGQEIHGIRVLGSVSALDDAIRRTGAKQAVITIAAASRTVIRRIVELCEKAGIPTKIVPGIYEIVGGKVNVSEIRTVAIEDLLGREPITLDDPAVATDLHDRIVLVTGAGGSIGSELARQIAHFRPKALILLEQAENALFNIHRELLAAHPKVTLIPIVADITDARRLEAVFSSHRPQVVFHAAAHKHVPMMEWNPGEAVKNNVIGTRNVADLAHAHRVRQFVMISTDKAVNPTSVMGTTKRVAEIYVQGLSQHSQTRFVTVRFGNVLGSNGSVIPIFQEQIARGGPVTVTHPEMTRYFMTIPEACQLVMQAGSMGEGGEIFVLDMGEPVKIVDLARDLIRLSGFKSDEIEIEFTGTRPGEKLFEELSTSEEKASKTRHPKIFIGHVRQHEWERILEQLDGLEDFAADASPEKIRQKLHEIVPEYAPPVAAGSRVA